MIIYLHPKNPEVRKLKEISANLKNGKVYIFPTDTVYAIVADSQSKAGIEKLYELKEVDKNKPLSLFCKDISSASHFVSHLPDKAFKVMKKFTPGPFTFILQANKNLPQISFSHQKTKTIGIRIPDNIYLMELLKIHDGALTCTSVFTNDEYITDIEDLEDMYGSRVEGIVDGGIAEVETSTILDFTGDEMEVLREGKGFQEIELGI